MNDYAIELTNVGKSFFLVDSPLRRLKLLFNNLIFGAYSVGSDSQKDIFYALQAIDLKIKKGESFGILGKNGAGKSTLLQIIARTLFPSSGQVIVQGKVNALLELGSGFNPEFTGRENVFLNGTVLGFSNSEIEKRFDEIVTFSEIDEFIDQPVKHYSSGMLIRLAFSVQAMLEPDILIVDEALAVGDIFFVQKCHDKIEQLLKTGQTTFVFVTHDLLSIQKYCNRAMVLDHGKCVFIGDSIQAIYEFQNLENVHKDTGYTKAIGEKNNNKLKSGVLGNINIVGPKDIVTLEKFHILDKEKKQSLVFLSGDTVHFEYEFLVLQEIDTPIFGIEIANSRNILIHSINNFISEDELPLSGKVQAGQRVKVRQIIKLSLEVGQYTMTAGFNMVSESAYLNRKSLSSVEISQAYQTAIRFINLPPITIMLPENKKHASFYGLVELETSFEATIA
jgi:lipopolysaccharide transport system ATP-binding protein